MGTFDFIPQSLNDFYVWQDKFFTRVLEKLNSFKMVESDVKALTAAKSKFDLGFGRASNPDSANRADRLERNERMAEYKTEIRKLINEHIRFNSNVSDYDRQYLGLTVADTTPTPAAVPTTYPVLDIDFSTPLHHTLHIKDEKLAGKRKPAGVKECQVWYVIADEKPTDERDMRYAGSTSNSTFDMAFALTEQGKRVWYWARWVNTRAQHGPWGVLMTAIIA